MLLAGAQIANESQDSSGFEMSFPDILGGVASLNGLTGALTLEAGANITIAPDGSSALKISATVAQGPAGPKGATGATGPTGPPGPVNATSTDTPNTAALRDGSGNFAMNTLSLDGNVNLPATTSSTGILFLGGQPFLHGFGVSNTFVGPDAGNLTMTGDFNTATGASAFASNTSGGDNTADGEGALGFNTTGADNTAVGVSALASNTTGPDNTAVGGDALFANTSGNLNTAVGADALVQNTTGGSNTGIGFGALAGNITGVNNTATGLQALTNNTADDNTATGTTALNNNTTGGQNTAVGAFALESNTTGNANIAIGDSAGVNLTTGSQNIDIGNQGVAAEGTTIRIGSEGVQTAAFVAGIRGATTGNNNAVAVVIDSNGQLGTISSSRRYKEDIRDMAGASDRLLRLRPVTFRYKKPFADGEKPIQYGLIAEEVAEIFPDLVAYGQDKRPETVKYQTLSSLLLNEVQKLHTKIQDQAARDDLTSSGRDDLAQKGLTEQRAAFAALASKVLSIERNAAATELARREVGAN